jgi:exosortase
MTIGLPKQDSGFPSPALQAPSSLREEGTDWGLFLFGGVAAGLVWSYWPVLVLFHGRWSTDPQYSHGFLIPIIAVCLLWMRDVPRDATKFQPSWLGLPLLAVGLGMRLWGGWFYFEWLEWMSLIPAVAGVCLATLGTKTFRFVWPSIAFLVFMIPLPYRLEVSLLQPLQNFATQCATLVLQTLGLAASAQGNVVWIGETAVGVAQACSGLRMLTVFVALATALAMIVERGWFDRVAILATAIPIAIVCNVFRVTVTAVVFTSVSDDGFRTSFHDWLGWGMPLLGMAMLWGELKLLDVLFVPVEESPSRGEAVSDRQVAAGIL